MSKQIDISNLKSLLLDLDGTLINSEKAFFNSFQKILKQHFNIYITMEDYKKYELEQNARLLPTVREQNKLIGISDNDIMGLIYEDYKVEFEKIILEKEAKENFELLKELKLLKLRLALVTTCRRFYLDILINSLNLENLFDVIIAREDVKNLKPASDAYQMALTYLNLGKEECLAIEDSKRGIDAAVNFGVKTIQVSNFTTLKYEDERAIQYNSANEFLSKLLCKIKETKF